jgi:hypothetical protein
MRWGRAYAVDYVNVLHSACRAAAREPIRFICLTDDSEGLAPGVEALPVPDIGLTAREWTIGGVWPKLALYVADLHGLHGRCLFIDLDMVVLRDLDSFFASEAPYVGIDAGPAWGRPGSSAAPQLGTGIIAFDIGAHAGLVEEFRREKTSILQRFRTEQAYIASKIPDIEYWPEGWVISFKRKLRRPLGLDLLMHPVPPPPEAKVLAFHGTPRPIDLMSGESLFWDRFPHMGRGRVPWMMDYWLGHGGRQIWK